MIHHTKPVAKNIYNVSWWIQGRTYLSYWPYRSHELAPEEKVVDSLIMVQKTHFLLSYQLRFTRLSVLRIIPTNIPCEVLRLYWNLTCLFVSFPQTLSHVTVNLIKINTKRNVVFTMHLHKREIILFILVSHQNHHFYLISINAHTSICTKVFHCVMHSLLFLRWGWRPLPIESNMKQTKINMTKLIRIN
jgi:hypothetical protein